MTWKEAIISVLTDEGRAMTYSEISQMIFSKRYRSEEKATHVNSLLTTNPDLFRMRGEGFYELRNTFVVDRPCSSYPSSDGKYKPASVFKNYEALSDLEMKLLELIVNFRIPLTVNREVCFADILDKLEVHISNDEKKRTQSVDATLLRQKLEELNSQINNNQGEQLETLLKNMSQVQELLGNTIDGMVQLPSYTILGEFFRDENNPRVVIYLESIKKKLKNHESRQDVMAAVFVHEMFHAWNYFNAGPNPEKSVREIEEPMVEFETLYFLQELEAYTKTHSHLMHKNVLSVRETRESRVKRKQQSIGDVAAYGFGYYLFKKLSESNIIKSRDWIETYSKKSAFIKGSYPLVEKATKALKPVYPFKSEDKVMRWFKKIIFDDRATSQTIGKPATTKVSNTTSDVIYKIRVNRPCRLFIDDEELMTLKENELTKITLPEGEYLRKVVAEDDTTIFDEKVISLFHPKVDDIPLDAISLEEAKRNALPDEIFQSNLYFKPTKDRLSVVVVGKREYVDTINIPDQIKYAGYVYPVIEVRLNSLDLKSITIPDGVKGICFEDCSSLTSIIIPNSLTYITWGAFKGCSSLRSITIPDSVTRICNYAFEDCDSLTAIDYTGTKEQWKEIEKDEFWKGLYKSIEIRCTDGNM